jgi:hypothetical protein
MQEGRGMRTLPVIKAINHAIKSTTDNIAFAFHISWPWIVMLMPLNIATNLYVVFNNLQPERGGQPDMAALGKFFMASFPLAIASIIAYASIAVNWHRYILLDEVPTGWQRLRVDGLMWRYIGNFILIFLIVMAAAFGAAIGFGLAGFMLRAIAGETVMAVILVPAAVALYVYAIMATYRLSVKLPAVALGRTEFSMTDVWKATEGNNWRLLGLLGLFLACMMLVGLATLLATLVFQSLGTVGLSVSIAIQVLVNWVATILGVTLLTSLYGFFVEGREF